MFSCLQSATFIATSKSFFYIFGINRNFVRTNGAGGIVIVPKAAWTFYHRSGKHIPILTMMTWFRGLFLNDWSGHYHFPHHCFQIDFLPKLFPLGHYCRYCRCHHQPRIRSLNKLFSFSNKSLKIFLFFIKRLSTPNYARPSRKVLSDLGWIVVVVVEFKQLNCSAVVEF